MLLLALSFGRLPPTGGALAKAAVKQATRAWPVAGIALLLLILVSYGLIGLGAEHFQAKWNHLATGRYG